MSGSNSRCCRRRSCCNFAPIVTKVQQHSPASSHSSPGNPVLRAESSAEPTVAGRDDLRGEGDGDAQRRRCDGGPGVTSRAVTPRVVDRPASLGKGVSVYPSATAMVWPGEGSMHEAVAVPGVRLSPGDVLVEIELATVCDSDLHTLLGHRPAPTPLVLGHEQVGRVVALGRGGAKTTDGLRVSLGERIVWSAAVPCGRCARCRRGLPQKCLALQKYGHERMRRGWELSGGFATHAHILDGTPMVSVPDERARRGARAGVLLDGDRRRRARGGGRHHAAGRRTRPHRRGRDARSHGGRDGDGCGRARRRRRRIPGAPKPRDGVRRRGRHRPRSASPNPAPSSPRRSPVPAVVAPFRRSRWSSRATPPQSGR